MIKIREIIANTPDTPGVYLMKDGAGTVIYVGKAKSLRKRLSSYLGKSLSDKPQVMMSRVADIEYQLCLTEGLALLRESNLIHQYTPRYNVSLRDDKSFPLVKITNEEFPAICITRKKEPDGARYYGPYTSARLLREALTIIRRHFPYRSCRELPKKPCMYYRIGLSPAPCIGKISKEEYASTIESIGCILEGKTDYLIKKLSGRMQEKARALKFEEAAQARGQIEALCSLGNSDTCVGRQQELEDLRRVLGLKKLPLTIEAFDISNVSGKEATGSMVSFNKGVADKDNYRRFRIKTIQGIDDYGMIREVVGRRYRRVLEENLPNPDLILIDGGKAHLLAAVEELAKIKLHLPVASIAKDRENIYVRGRARPITFSRDTPALNLVRRIRDEAHRFALKYHHLLHKKKVLGE